MAQRLLLTSLTGRGSPWNKYCYRAMQGNGLFFEGVVLETLSGSIGTQRRRCQLTFSVPTDSSRLHASQQLTRQKLEAVARAKTRSSFPFFRQVITFQSTSNQAATNVQSVERTPAVNCGSEFKPGLRFVTASSSSLSPLDSAFLELVDLLPQCWRSPHTAEHNQKHWKPETQLSNDNGLYLTAIEADAFFDEETRNQDEEEVLGDVELGNQAVEEKKIKRKKLRELYKRQVKVETEAWRQAATEYKEMMMEMCRKNLAPNLPFAQSLLLGWFEPLRDGILEDQRAYANREHREHRSIYGPYICQLPAEMLAVITMHRLMGLLMSDQEHGCVKVVHAAVLIGEAVEQEVRIYQLMNSKKKWVEGNTATTTFAANEEELEASRQADVKSKKVVRDKVKRLVKQNKLRRVDSILKHASTDEPWSTVVHVKLGSRLLELMLETSFVRAPASQDGDDDSELRPAFQHKFKNHMLRKNVNRIYGVIECDPLVLSEMDQSVKHMVMPYMPMLVKPLPWKGFNEGGYLHLKSSIMRTQGAKEQRMAIIDTPHKNMKVVVEALNVLGQIPWKINKRVLEVVEKLWEDGGGVADLVESGEVPIPERPEVDMSEKEVWHKWKVEISQAKRTNSERHSIRCHTELKLGVARKMCEEEAFYYPHNLDFRGRAYPMHPHLNHLGNDLCRGLLVFADGKPLGSHGLRWMKIQLANLHGGSVGKMSFEDRAAFIDSHMEDVLDSAERPLDGRRWWLKAEDPFQFLAACFDVSDAVASGDPENFVSFLPVHQDGSCNGLQHYAALGRDRIGAESVNLIAGDKPSDVYTGIAERVRSIMEKDALKNPLTSRNAASARLLLGQIDRKLVKQTVMTSVYGVTFVGARMQILSRLKERSPIATNPVDIYRAACYAAKVTLDALGEMFKEARFIMSWLGDCAKIIAAAGHTVKWTSPLGLPVVQPYRKHSRHLVKTSLQVLALRSSDDTHPVLVCRQRSAFPPNFVHSLDSSHMMMTALASQKAGLTFAGVHDSYWTHAGDVDQMNVLLRKNFVKLYKQPILENLLKDFQQQFPHLTFPDVPARGDFDMKEVLKSPYFFN